MKKHTPLLEPDYGYAQNPTQEYFDIFAQQRIQDSITDTTKRIQEELKIQVQIKTYSRKIQILYKTEDLLKKRLADVKQRDPESIRKTISALFEIQETAQDLTEKITNLEYEEKEIKKQYSQETTTKYQPEENSYMSPITQKILDTKIKEAEEQNKAKQQFQQYQEQRETSQETATIVDYQRTKLFYS